MVMKVASVYFNFANKGGAQKMALDLARLLCDESDALPVMLTSTPLDRIDPDLRDKAKFMTLTLRNLRRLSRDGYIVLSHDRRSTTRIMLWRKLQLLKIKVVHVAHSVFDNLRFATILPSNVVAISTAVMDNLIGYFGLAPERITLIYNGLADLGHRKINSRKDIHIVLAGRICSVKRQVEIARALAGRIPEGVSLCFAGTGEQADLLTEAVAAESRMSYVGHLDMSRHIADFDYVLLFSEKEGLPLTLIEACMAGKPMITNDIRGALDINIAGETGFVCRDFDELARLLDSLPKPSSESYKCLSDNARHRYEECFSVDRMTAQYRALLEKVVCDK